MTMDFYYGSGSPYAWRVWLALEHKQIPYSFKLLSFSAGDTRKPEFLALNPRHTVPLIVDEGFALYESAAILEYLDERFPQAPMLFAGKAQERAIARRIICEADGYFSPVREVLSKAVFWTKQEEWQPEAIAEAAQAVVDELARFEAYIGDHGFLAYPAPGAADFTLYPMVALAMRADARCQHVQLRGRIPQGLTSWMARIEALPYFDKTIPPHWKSA